MYVHTTQVRCNPLRSATNGHGAMSPGVRLLATSAPLGGTTKEIKPAATAGRPPNLATFRSGPDNIGMATVRRATAIIGTSWITCTIFSLICGTGMATVGSANGDRRITGTSPTVMNCTAEPHCLCQTLELSLHDHKNDRDELHERYLHCLQHEQKD